MLSLEVHFRCGSSKHYLLTRNRWNCRTRSGQSLNRKSKRVCSCSRSWCQVCIELVIALSAHTDIVSSPSDQGIFNIQVPFLGPTVLPSRFASSLSLFRILTLVRYATRLELYYCSPGWNEWKDFCLPSWKASRRFQQCQ